MNHIKKSRNNEIVDLMNIKNIIIRFYNNISLVKN